MGQFEYDFSQYGFSTGMRLAACRRLMGLRQDEAAAAAEISRAYLSMLENDRRRLTLHVADRLADVLGVTVYDLLATVVRDRTRRDVSMQRYRGLSRK